MNTIIRTSLILFFSILSLNSFSQQLGTGYESFLPVSDFNQPILSGAYQATSPIIGGVPDQSHSWQHLFSIRHSNSANNHQLQIATSYTANDKLFFRKVQETGAVTNTHWLELATRESNTFNGNQVFNGTATSNNEFISTMVNGICQFRAVYGNSGIMFRNDGDNSYFLLTTGNPYGSWNSLRPFYIDNKLGDVILGSAQIIAQHSTGRLGVGTLDPKAKLQVNSDVDNAFDIADNSGTVNFRVKTSGVVYAREINVQLDPFPDYVFEKNYKLMSIPEVSAFIEKNHHLPNMPTASEVAKNGANLGEIQRVSVEKIEELYKYIIQLEQEMTALKKEMNELKSK